MKIQPQIAVTRDTDMTQEEQEAIVFEQEQNWDYGNDLDDWLL